MLLKLRIWIIDIPILIQVHQRGQVLDGILFEECMLKAFYLLLLYLLRKDGTAV